MTPSSTQDATSAPAQMPTIPSSQPLNESVNATSLAVDPTQVSSPDVSGALTYVDSVRERYKDNAAVYAEFLDIMKEYKQGRLDHLNALQCISRLFLGSPDHIEGYNAFLPSTLQLEISRTDPDHPAINLITRNPNGTIHTLPIDLSEEETARLATALRVQSPVVATHPQGLEFSTAINFLDKVRARYGREDNSLYRAFLGFMQQQQKGELPLDEMTDEVEVLLRNAPDLWDEFQDFLPTLSANAVLATV